MTTELKPCLFCGGSATIERKEFGVIEMGCDNVGCGVLPSATQLSVEYASNAWNTRATPAPAELETVAKLGGINGVALVSHIKGTARGNQNKYHTDLVLKDQAAAMLAAANERAQKAEKWAKEQHACAGRYAAELAQNKAQVPIMCLYDRDNGDGTYSKVTEVFPLPKHARPVSNSVTTPLYAAPVASEPCSVEVKKLEWDDASGVSEAKRFDHIVRYCTVEVHNGKGDHSWTLEFNGKFFQQSKSREEAKAAAQAHFEQRILSQIVTKPVASEAETIERCVNAVQAQADKINISGMDRKRSITKHLAAQKCALNDAVFALRALKGASDA